MSNNYPKLSHFVWTPKRSDAAELLAQGYTINETAERVGVSEKTIDRWKRDIEFISEVDRLSLMIDIASRSERLKIAKRVVRGLLAQRKPTERDLLDWLKYAQSETDGVKLDLTALFEAASSMADPGQTGISGETTEDDDASSEVQE